MSKRIFHTKDITEPNAGLVVFKDSYWLCEDGDPKRALFFGDSPQCNQNKNVTEYLANTSRYKDRGNLQIVFVPIAFVAQRD